MRARTSSVFLTVMCICSAAMPVAGQTPPDTTLEKLKLQSIELLNPDGSPASDVRTIGVQQPVAYFDADLNVVSLARTSTQQGQNANAIAAEGSIMLHANTRALVAASPQGFAFTPKSLASNKFPEKVTLRPWATLKLDTSTVPEKLRTQYQMEIVWRNNFAGHVSDLPPQRSKDPFGTFASPLALDWRFTPYVAWCKKVDMEDQTVMVPPGEVTITLSRAQPGINLQPPTLTLGIVRTVSSQTAEFKLPEFGSVTGRCEVGTELPNWENTSGINHRLLHIIPAQSIEVSAGVQRSFEGLEKLSRSTSDPFGGPGPIDNPFSDPPSTGNRKLADEYARYLSSPEGTQYRYRQIGKCSSLVDNDGKFVIELLPVGKYKLKIYNQNSTTLAEQEAWLARTGQFDDAKVFEINTNQTLDLDVSNELAALRSLSPPVSESPLDLRPVQSWRSSLSSAASTLRSPSGSSPAENLAKQWLQTAGPDADREQLKELLQKHLETEFAVQQQSRRAELERLQTLLDQSRQWLDQRDERRAETIQNRLQELIENQ